MDEQNGESMDEQNCESMGSLEETTTQYAVFNEVAYDKAMQYGDEHDVAIEKGWGIIEEGESEDVVLIEE